MLMRTLRTVAWVLLGIVVVGNIAGCNTIRGIGKDIQAGGRAIERAARN